MAFTLDGSEALEQQIQRDMDQVRDAALDAVGADDLTALVLGGGYGRGEGGVYAVDGAERVYNDYDLFVVVPFSSRIRRKRVQRLLHGVKEKLEPVCGIHVDFSPPMPASGLASLPYELMFMEAKMGHRVIYGPEDVFAAIPDFDPARPPLDECARLFMNRGIGLMLAGMKLRQPEPLEQEDHEFVVRNMYKAMMAMGDSVLFIQGAYSTSYQERRTKFPGLDLSGVPEPEQLKAVYDASLEFKLRPNHDVPPGTTLHAWHAETVALYKQVFLWFERQRLESPDLDWEAYERMVSRLPAQPWRERGKNVVRNFRNRAGQPLPVNEWLLHPRDRMLRRLPGLLFSESTDPGEERLMLRLWKNFG